MLNAPAGLHVISTRPWTPCKCDYESSNTSILLVPCSKHPAGFQEPRKSATKSSSRATVV